MHIYYCSRVSGPLETFTDLSWVPGQCLGVWAVSHVGGQLAVVSP